jgi:signal transduction histidine kinase/ActR/RegA family two-component response regulator
LIFPGVYFTIVPGAVKMPLNGKKRRSLGVRLIMVILLASLFLSTVTVAVGYIIYRDSRERGYIRIGQSLTRTVRNIVDGDSLDRYLSSGVTDEAHETTLFQLQNIGRENAVQNLYVVRLAETGWHFIFDKDAPSLGLFDPFDPGYPEFKEQALAGTIEPIISNTQWGWLLSVYEPILNGKNELVGYVGADFSMDRIVAERRSYLLHLTIITLLVSAGFAFLYILVIQKTIILPVNTMAKAADGYLAPQDGKARSSISALDIRTNDELESLAEAMKSMDLKIHLAIIDLKKAEKESQTALRAKTAFLAQMSHELRTPLNAIMGNARAVLYAADDRERVIHALKEILSSSQHLLTILNDILDISNIENGKLTLMRDVFSMADVCRGLNDLIRLQCTAKGITFFPDNYQVSNTIVWGDRVRLMQAAGNILNNAVKFTKPGGEIRFTAEVKEQTEDTVKIRFVISDTGIGISPDRRKSLFQAFVSVDRDVSISYGGIGAKLSICKSIVEMMGGHITVESELGRGSVFSFEIPFDKAESKDLNASPEEFGESPPDQNTEVDLSGKKILVVDDVAANRAIVRLALKNTGVGIVEAKDGLQAVEIVTKLAENINLILMDISMPNMNGYDAARAIRGLNEDWAKTTPIIALTAHTYQEDVEAALEAGMDFHLGKPVNFSILLSTMEQYLLT